MASLQTVEEGVDDDFINILVHNDARGRSGEGVGAESGGNIAQDRVNYGAGRGSAAEAATESDVEFVYSSSTTNSNTNTNTQTTPRRQTLLVEDSMGVVSAESVLTRALSSQERAGMRGRPSVMLLRKKEEDDEDARGAAAALSSFLSSSPRAAPPSASAPASAAATGPCVVRYKPYFVRTIMLVNISVFVYSMYLNGWEFEDPSINPLYGPSSEVLLSMGALRADLVQQGEWWRLIASMFLHGGIIHLVSNMLALHRVGSELEREFGWKRVVPLYFLSGIFGGLVSMVFLPDVLGVGASAAIFGLFGGAWAGFIQNFRLYEQPVWVLVSLILCTALNLVIGLLPLINNFAHLGGLVGGLLLGFSMCVNNTHGGIFMFRPPVYQKPLQLIGYPLFSFCFAVVVAAFYFKVDPHGWCSWCKYLSCIETPWWSCDATEAYCTGESTAEGKLQIVCPDGSRYDVDSTADFNEENCRKFCF